MICAPESGVPYAEEAASSLGLRNHPVHIPNTHHWSLFRLTGSPLGVILCLRPCNTLLDLNILYIHGGVSICVANGGLKWPTPRLGDKVTLKGWENSVLEYENILGFGVL
jgi:hypothetical protein